MHYCGLDKQLERYSCQLIENIGLDDDETRKLATLIAAEVRFLDPCARAQIIGASPVPLQDRLDELRSFQSWMELASHTRGNPGVTRAQVVVENYVCFVYLGEACFRALRATARSGSVTRRCCQFLTDNPIRAFRNAIAHSNWTYLPDFSGLAFWARKGADSNEELSQFEVTQAELDFWQALSRSVAYAAYTSIEAIETAARPNSKRP